VVEDRAAQIRGDPFPEPGDQIIAQRGRDPEGGDDPAHDQRRAVERTRPAAEPIVDDVPQPLPHRERERRRGEQRHRRAKGARQVGPQEG